MIGPIKPFVGKLTPKKRPGIITKLLAKLGAKGVCQGSFARTYSGSPVNNDSELACSHCASGWLRLCYQKVGYREQAFAEARNRFLSTALKLYPKLIKSFAPTIVAINDAYLSPRRIVRVFKEAGL